MSRVQSCIIGDIKKKELCLLSLCEFVLNPITNMRLFRQKKINLTKFDTSLYVVNYIASIA